jgi:predicted nucleic acid-binding protein
MPVVDASVLVSLFLTGDRNHKKARLWIENALKDGEVLRIPIIAFAEIGGAIARQTGDAPTANRVIRELQALGMEIHDIDEELGRKGADLAMSLKLRGADSFYVALAHATGDELVSFDEEQLKRAQKVIDVVQPK